MGSDNSAFDSMHARFCSSTPGRFLSGDLVWPDIGFPQAYLGAPMSHDASTSITTTVTTGTPGTVNVVSDSSSMAR